LVPWPLATCHHLVLLSKLSSQDHSLTKDAPCWNKKRNGLRAKTRKLFNTAERTGQWDTYKEILTCYNKEIRKAKQSSWSRYCQEINDVPGSARLMKIMAKQTTNRASTIKISDGQYTQTGRETLKVIQSSLS
jgi:hypothetical protein